jgi:DNA-binding phage protein
METAYAFDVDKMRGDIAAKGWLPTDLARVAGFHDETIARHLRGDRSNPRTVKRMAEALGFGIKRYLILRTQQPVRRARRADFGAAR